MTLRPKIFQLHLCYIIGPYVSIYIFSLKVPPRWLVLEIALEKAYMPVVIVQAAQGDLGQKMIASLDWYSWDCVELSSPRDYIGWASEEWNGQVSATLTKELEWPPCSHCHCDRQWLMKWMQWMNSELCRHFKHTSFAWKMFSITHIRICP